MNIFLEEREKDINAFKQALELCKEDSNVVKVLETYLKRIEREYSESDFLKTNFIPLIQNKDNFNSAFIFCADDGDYTVDVYVLNLDDDSKKEYRDIYNNFCKDNDETFFFFNVYDLEKNKDEYEESMDYDKIIITKGETL